MMMLRRRLLLVVLFGVAVTEGFFHVTSSRHSSTLLAASKGPKADEKTVDPLTKASWYADEAFGKAFGGKKQKQKESGESEKVSDSIDLSKPPSSLSETLERLKLDTVDRSYFVSGDVDALIYDADCIFADPFASFAGRDRFVENLSNLGSFVTKYDTKMINYDTSGVENVPDGAFPIVNAKIMVKLELNLPWKPVLAWPWGVEYTIDPTTNLVTKHVESWDIAPIKGVLQIFRKPTVQIK